MAKGMMIIDGQRVSFDGEKNVLSVIRKAGIEMPTFCYYSDLSVYGACRMCMVEDLDTGKIAGQGHDEELKKYDRHPTTGIELKGYQMPMHEEVKALALKAALMYPEFHYVGWDICMTEKGPAIIEGNDFPGTDLCQLAPFYPEKEGLWPYYKKLLHW